MMTGRISSLWTESQKIYWQKEKIDKLPRRWASALIRKLFLVAWDLWKDRNNIKHSSESAAAKREMRKLDEEIDELRQAGTAGIPESHLPYLLLSPERQADMDLIQKRRWVLQAENIRQAHANHTEPVVTTISENNRLLTDWVSVTSSLTDTFNSDHDETPVQTADL